MCGDCSQKKVVDGVSDKPTRVCSKCTKAIAQERLGIVQHGLLNVLCVIYLWSSGQMWSLSYCTIIAVRSSRTFSMIFPHIMASVRLCARKQCFLFERHIHWSTFWVMWFPSRRYISHAHGLFLLLSIPTHGSYWFVCRRLPNSKTITWMSQDASSCNWSHLFEFSFHKRQMSRKSHDSFDYTHIHALTFHFEPIGVSWQS